MFQIFPKYDEKKFANVVTGNEIWVYYSEPVRKISNEIWTTKNSKRPVIAKHVKCKEGLYALFSGEGVAIQMPVKKAKALLENTTKMWYWKKLKNYRIRKGAQSRVSNMSDFYMIMPQPIHLPLLQIFCKKKGNSINDYDV